MSQIQRYDVGICPDCGCEWKCDAGPKEAVDGYWVAYSDHKARVEALQRENALLKDTNGIYFDFNKISDLIAENERLKAPVSDEESGFFWWRSGPDDLITSREGVNRLIASRATQPAPQEGK
jgi:hypothetical protein